MRFGITLAHTHASLWVEATRLADELGLESVWIPDHLVFTLDLAGSPYPGGGGAPPVTPDVPLFDCPAVLSHLAAHTSRVRLGTFVHVYALRHPLVAARGFATADLLSGGRVEVGVGAGWLEGEWRAAGLDFRTRGRRLDEAIAVTRRLWADEVVEHHGEFWQWEPLRFDPKPAQPGGPPILVGGESTAARRRAAWLADGWMSMPHTPESIGPQVDTIHAERRAAGRAHLPFSVTGCTLGLPTAAELSRWEAAGVDRLIVRPWARVRDTLDGLRRLADAHPDHLSGPA